MKNIRLEDLNVKIYADGADLKGILEMYARPYIRGFTTNPTLMKAAGIKDYEKFAQQVLERIQDRPFSFEVFADDFSEMKRQALKIHQWGNNVYVKIPATNTQGLASDALVEELVSSGVRLNVTAVFTFDQIKRVALALKNAKASIISVFAGRIADSGIDPVPYMLKAKQIIKSINPNIELLWASPREVLNIIQANDIQCDIITVSNDILKKVSSLGKDLELFALDTVKMFYNDASHAGYQL